MFKTLLKILLGLIFLLVAAAVVLPIIFKDDLVQLVKTEANKNLNAEVDFGEFDLSLLSSFPNLTFEIENVKVNNKAPFEGVTLANIGKFSTTLDLMNVVTGSTVSINEIAISDATIYVKVLEDGTANYDIALASEETEEETAEEESSSEDFRLDLQRYSLKNVNLIYDDRMYATYVETKNFSHTGAGDFTLDVFLLETQTNIEAFTVKYEDIAYFNKTAVDLDMDLDMDLNAFKFTFKENRALLNQLELRMDGWLSMPEEDIDMDLTLSAPNNSFKSLLSLVPAVYAKDFESVETSGNFSFGGTFKGTYNDNSLPAFNLTLAVNDGRFNYPDLPKSAENINIDLKIDNPDGVEDHTTINLEKFHVELGDNPIDFNMFLKDPVSDPDFRGAIQSQINFESLADVVPLDEGMRFAGTVTADASFAGKMSSLENERYEEFKASGKMIMNAFEYEDPALDYPVKIKNAYLEFSPEKVALTKFDMVLGGSDMALTGAVSNYLPYYLHEEVLRGTLSLSSTAMDVDELMGEEEAETTEQTDTSEEGEEGYEVIEVPENLDLKFTATIGKMIYDGMEMTNLTGLITVKERVAKLDRFSMGMLDGTISMEGTYKTPEEELPTADFKLGITNFDVQKTFKTFNTVQKIAPIGESATGRFSTNMNFSTVLQSNMEPDLNTLDGEGIFRSNNIVIEGSDLMGKVGEVMKNDKYKKLELNDTRISFSFQNGEVKTQPFEVNIAGRKALVSGSSYFDQRIDYLISTEVPRSEFGAAANQTINTLLSQVKSKTGVDLDANETIDLELVIGGTMTEPTVKPRVAGVLGGEAGNAVDEVKEAVKEKVKEKVEETKEDINKKIAEERAKLVKQATAQGDKLVAEAKQQKANLVKGAESQAAKLKKEAEAQAKKLKDDAGGNPIKKKAAEIAGDKLIKEADEKGKKLIDEANKKGDDLVKKAQAEKQRLIKEAETKEISL